MQLTVRILLKVHLVKFHAILVLLQICVGYLLYNATTTTTQIIGLFLKEAFFSELLGFIWVFWRLSNLRGIFLESQYIEAYPRISLNFDGGLVRGVSRGHILHHFLYSSVMLESANRGKLVSDFDLGRITCGKVFLSFLKVFCVCVV